MKQLFLAITLLFICPRFCFAQTSGEGTKHLNLHNGHALQGYDPVAYFTKNKAVHGSDKISATYNGAAYYFSSDVNKQQFLKDPNKYEPKYGGWCAFAMGDYGKKVDVNPETFKIIDGKLYLFYNAYFTNTLKSWNLDETNLKSKAETNWAKLANER